MEELLVKNVSYHLDKTVVRGYDINHSGVKNLSLLVKYFDYCDAHGLTENKNTLEDTILGYRDSCSTLCK